MFEADWVQNTLTPILAICGAVFGIIGTALGILNYRLHRKRYTVKLGLKATPYRSYSNGTLTRFSLKVVVINHSPFEVTISKLGFSQNVRRKRKDFPFLTGENLPARLGALDEHSFEFLVKKESAFGFTDLTAEDVSESMVGLLVETSTGVMFRAGRNELRQFLDLTKELAETGTIRKNVSQK